MGVKRKLSLQELKSLFPSYIFTSLIPSSSGVIDTTYICDKYIVKFYERDIKEKISLDTKLLGHLHNASLNVPLLLSSSEGWYLYEKLQGTTPKSIQLYHIQVLARFMAKLHAQNIRHRDNFLNKCDIKGMLLEIKKRNYHYYKKLELLKHYKPKNDGFIHGDLFKDNTVFYGKDIGVFDFIDGGNGSYVFDIAVALLSFNPSRRRSYTKLFLKTYNQTAPQKIIENELIKTIKIASVFYAMQRINKQKDIKRAKELIFW